MKTFIITLLDAATMIIIHGDTESDAIARMPASDRVLMDTYEHDLYELKC